MCSLYHRALVPLSTPSDSELEQYEGFARTLNGSGWYKVARRFQPRSEYAPDDGQATNTGLFVDVETTGLDTLNDLIIQFAAVPFRYGKTSGRIYTVDEGVSFFEDPGRPIPAVVAELTGITDEMVHGKRIDDTRVDALLAEASLVIAHNAAFDRKIVERRLPAFATKPWACSRDEVPWHEHGCTGTKLEYILWNTARSSSKPGTIGGATVPMVGGNPGTWMSRSPRCAMRARGWRSTSMRGADTVAR
jgi:DNA polymerase III subunit epsilon